MRKNKVITHYRGMKLDELHTLAGKVADCLSDTTTFPNPPISVAELQAAVADYQIRWQTLKNDGGRVNRIRRDNARDKLFDMFSILATYVNQFARGDAEILQLSGFYPEAERKATTTPSAPVFIELIDGPQKNQLELRLPPLKSNLFYEYQYADALDDSGQPLWGEIIVISKRSDIIAPTVPATIYYARVRSRNKVNCSDWSATVSLMAR